MIGDKQKLLYLMRLHMLSTFLDAMAEEYLGRKNEM